MSLYLADFNLVACDFIRFHLIVILKQCKLFIQHLVLDIDCLSVETLEELKQIWLRRTTCILCSKLIIKTPKRRL